MFFDTCYSGQTREEETLLASARPIRIIADEQERARKFYNLQRFKIRPFHQDLKMQNMEYFLII